ncbi:RluA family pseudouridine synthase [Oceanobacillus piezotolerans]|uniref:Pseudouridine synthase n=1 Tax=Oceanobacillus piezotolerans TaxID=2448030 RepID=A0A498DDL5_9BACI|nr:RluA family pseudouridine synthase [Oceanobacillus piezotolerans]RLL45074.1 RluA family pseudouridine synthase [Oceanobacillus piezotolerans]
MKWVISQEHHKMLVRDYLKDVGRFSRRILIDVKKNGKILVNGLERTVRHVLLEGDQLQVVFPPETIGTYMKKENIPLNIVYEDEAVVVIDKPAGIPTIPSLHHPAASLANGLLAYYEKMDIPYTVHVVTRLDRDTSGLVLIAKHRYSHSLLAASQKSGKIKRKYQAIVEGIPAEKEGKIDAPIGRKKDSIIERMVLETGKPALTHYRRLNTYTSHSLLDIQLETGRTHQIRVHFAYLHHPLAGDDLYGGQTNIINRQALHCYELTFEHPFSHEMIQITSNLPDDMLSALKRIEKD